MVGTGNSVDMCCIKIKDSVLKWELTEWYNRVLNCKFYVTINKGRISITEEGNLTEFQPTHLLRWFPTLTDEEAPFVT